MAAVFPWARTSRFRSMIVDTTQPPPAHRAPHAPLWRPNRSAAELSLVGVLTPLCVKTLVQAAWVSVWRARKSVMTRW